MNLKDDIQPLTTFRNHSVALMRQLKETKRPMVLTVNGRAEAIVQDVEAYQRLLDLATLGSEQEGIRQGEEEIRLGRTRPIEEFFEEFEREHDISR